MLICLGEVFQHISKDLEYKLDEFIRTSLTNWEIIFGGRFCRSKLGLPDWFLHVVGVAKTLVYSGQIILFFFWKEKLQLMVNCPNHRNPNHRAPNQQLTIGWKPWLTFRDSPFLQVHCLEDTWTDFVPLQPHVSLHAQEQRVPWQRCPSWKKNAGAEKFDTTRGKMLLPFFSPYVGWETKSCKGTGKQQCFWLHPWKFTWNLKIKINCKGDSSEATNNFQIPCYPAQELVQRLRERVIWYWRMRELQQNVWEKCIYVYVIYHTAICIYMIIYINIHDTWYM